MRVHWTSSSAKEWEPYTKYLFFLFPPNFSQKTTCCQPTNHVSFVLFCFIQCNAAVLNLLLLYSLCWIINTQIKTRTPIIDLCCVLASSTKKMHLNHNLSWLWIIVLISTASSVQCKTSSQDGW